MTTHPDTAAALAAALQQTAFSTGTVSAPLKRSGTVGTIPSPNAAPEALAAYARRVKLRMLPDTVIQAEFFIGQKTFHRNIPAGDCAAFLEACFSGIFSRGDFTGPAGTASVLANKKGTLTLITTEKHAAADTAAAAAQNDTGHDRFKRRIIPEGTPVPFLMDLGVMNAEGTVYKSMYPKYRQINRFLEFVADILPRLRERAREKEGEPLRIVDFGCGKSYLTFALYYYLRTIENLPVLITGLDLKEDVIDHCNTLARTYEYSGLSFMVGDIARYAGEESIDMVVSLHACDTATDYALARAVQWGAPVIFAVPCCQHELNAQISAGSAKTGPANALEPLLRNGLIRERFSALLTDTLRAELLESAGYTVQLVEFIDMSHTPKNILIRAVRGKSPGTGPSDSYRTLATFFGVSPALERELFPGTPGGKD